MSSPRRSVSLPIVLSSTAVGLSIFMLVAWILVLIRNRAVTKEVVGNTWLMVAGVVSFGAIMTVLVLFTVFLVREIREVRLQDSFIDSVTHELKSPLASMKLCLETLARPGLPPDKRDELQAMMVEDVDRLTSLIDSVLAASRVTMGKQPKGVARVEVARVVDAVVSRVAARRHIGEDCIELDVPAGLSFVSDPEIFDTVLLNLIDNAVKYSGDEPRVRVRAWSSAQRVHVEVSDDGIGIAEADLRRVFQRFYRAPEEAVRERHGTGLGLFIVSALVRRLGGRVEAHSEGRGKGTTMHVWLPHHGTADPTA